MPKIPRTLPILILIHLLALLSNAPARAAEPLDLVPAESLLCWYGRPLPGLDTQPQQKSALRTLLDFAPRFAGSSVNAQAKLWVRIGDAFALMIRYPHAIVLIDAQAKPAERNPEYRQVDQLRFALIVQCAGDFEPFLRIIQAAVNEQTDTANANLQRKKAGRWQFQVLTDNRQPQWAHFAWGRIGDHFVFTVGENVWPHIAAVATDHQPSILSQKWVQTARGNRAKKAQIEIIVAAKGIRQRLDPFVQNRATDFFKAWHADDIDHAHWAIGLEQRALFCLAHFRYGDRVALRRFADPEFASPQILNLIPPQANYAVFDLPVGNFINRLVAGLVSTRAADTRQKLQQRWQQIQQDHGFNAQADILDNLGDRLILHNHPPHPLHLPLAVTSLTPINANPKHVRDTLEKMCHAWKNALEQPPDENTPPSPTRLLLAPDGIWSLQFGFIAGPAWTVTDTHIITSWSPQALRTYLQSEQSPTNTTKP